MILDDNCYKLHPNIYCRRVEMVLTRQEKEKLILDLYNEGRTYKQIAEIARVSPRDIKPVIEKAEKEREKELGINSQEENNGGIGSIEIWIGI